MSSVMPPFLSATERFMGPDDLVLRWLLLSSVTRDLATFSPLQNTLELDFKQYLEMQQNASVPEE
eukprot:3104041-Pleurochrysis_carterae.AAC.1